MSKLYKNFISAAARGDVPAVREALPHIGDHERILREAAQAAVSNRKHDTLQIMIDDYFKVYPDAAILVARHAAELGDVKALMAFSEVVSLSEKIFISTAVRANKAEAVALLLTAANLSAKDMPDLLEDALRSADFSKTDQPVIQMICEHSAKYQPFAELLSNPRVLAAAAEKSAHDLLEKWLRIAPQESIDAALRQSVFAKPQSLALLATAATPGQDVSFAAASAAQDGDVETLNVFLARHHRFDLVEAIALAAIAGQIKVMDGLFSVLPTSGVPNKDFLRAFRDALQAAVQGRQPAAFSWLMARPDRPADQFEPALKAAILKKDQAATTALVKLCPPSKSTLHWAARNAEPGLAIFMTVLHAADLKLLERQRNEMVRRTPAALRAELASALDLAFLSPSLSAAGSNPCPRQKI